MITSNIELTKIANKLNIPSFFVCSKDELNENIGYKNYILNMSDSDNIGTHWLSLIIIA